MAKPSPEEITGLLLAWGKGDKAALDRVIRHLSGTAASGAPQMRRERAGDTLQTTALVNEAYLRLVDYERMQPRGPRTLPSHRRAGHAAHPHSHS